MTGTTIAVIGATGRTGRPLVRELVRRGARIRCLSRGPEQPGLFPREVEWRLGDLRNVETLAAAFRGAESIHYIPPSLDERDPDYTASIIDAAEKAGVARVVYHSVLHSNTPEMPHHIRKAGCERLFRHSALAWTVLQPAMYVQTVLSFLSEDRTALRPPFNPDRPFNVIAPVDLVGAIARVLRDPATAYGTFEIAGSERLSIREMAAELGTALGRPIRVEVADMKKQVATRAARRGWSVPQQGEYRAMLSYYDRFGLPGNGLTLEMLLGRPPTTFAAAARALLGI